MSKFYLITGFLGAGKTTFLKKFIHLFSSEKMHIIVNEFGKEGIDGEVMKELGIAVDEINNGSIFCSCRLDKFEDVLQNTLLQNPELIIVEASGLSDPTNVKKILGQQDKFSGIEYMGCICLIDAVQFLKVYHTATVVKKQINVCDMIIINKTDLVTSEQLDSVKVALKQHRPDIPIYETTYGKIQEEWLQDMSISVPLEDSDLLQTADITLRKYLLHIRKNASLIDIQHFLKMILDDTYRIKGYIYSEQQWYLINCVGNMLSIEPCEEKDTSYENKIVVLSGHGLPVKKAIKTAMKWYPNLIESLE